MLDALKPIHETILKIPWETRPTDGRLQVHIIRELQKEFVNLIEPFQAEPVFPRISKRIHVSNMTKSCRNLEEAELSARRLWDPQNVMAKYVHDEGRTVLQR